MKRKEELSIICVKVVVERREAIRVLVCALSNVAISSDLESFLLSDPNKPKLFIYGLSIAFYMAFRIFVVVGSIDFKFGR